MINTIDIYTDPRVPIKFSTYPDAIRPKLEELRALIIAEAKVHKHIITIEETLKWGEPSYITPIGSTIRIDYKTKAPEQYAMYFKCTTSLVPTFKTVYGSLFRYEKNRALVFALDDILPIETLKKCIACALMYHNTKNMPRLGLV